MRTIAIDLEGDGNHPVEPVEIAILEVDGPDAGTLHTWRVNPGTAVTRFVTRIHGLSDADLADEPAFDRIAPELTALIDGAVVIGHAVGGDMKILYRKLPDLAPAKVIDTLRIARMILPGQPSYKLHRLAEAQGVPAPRDVGRGAHSAGYDAVLTAGLFARLVDAMGAKREAWMRQAEVGRPTSQASMFPAGTGP